MRPLEIVGCHRPSADERQRIVRDHGGGITEHGLPVLAGIDRRDQDDAVGVARGESLAGPQTNLECPESPRLMIVPVRDCRTGGVHEGAGVFESLGSGYLRSGFIQPVRDRSTLELDQRL